MDKIHTQTQHQVDELFAPERLINTLNAITDTSFLKKNLRTAYKNGERSRVFCEMGNPNLD